MLLHSTVALLEDGFKSFQILHEFFLHSTVALLEAAVSGTVIGGFTIFTFYCSSIRSPDI